MELRSIFIFGLLVLFLGSFYFFTGVRGDVVLEDEKITIIPVKAHLIVDDSNQYSSIRSSENIIELFEDVNRIWDRGDIFFQLEEIVVTRVSWYAIPQAINGDYVELRDHENFDNEKINLFLVQSLNNLNGLAIYRINSALVADFTTVNDFRTTAHEFGHLLELKHVEPSTSLMARGKNESFYLRKN